ncbi:MAG: hypothetical protein MJZ14_07810, partial [Paludibacteraceae bacterium]|nr:hypothetical protein [Paludibacteraceae bacterium]
DPKFSQSVAAKITAADTAKWNKKVTTESDPSFKASPASKITLSDIQNWDNKVAIESDPQFAISPAAQITPTDIQSWNSKVSSEQDPLFSQSPAAQIGQSDIQAWNNKISTENDPVFLNSVAANITAKDTARWGRHTVVPKNISQFTNDAKYITENDAKEMVQQLSTLSSQIETLINNNKSLTQRIDSLNGVINRLQSKLTTYGKAANNSYAYSTTGWNYGPDLYYGLKEGDRIIYIIRHSERDENCSGKECDLNSNGVTLAQNVGKNYVSGKAGANQSYYYGSTEYPRCKNTSYLVAINRGDTEISSKEAINNPIAVIDQKYIVGSESNWDNIAKYYGQYPSETDKAATTMINTLCQLTEGKTFSWFTSHDFLTVPLCGWASNGGLNFARPNWMNFMSGIAVIVHPNGSWEVYPVRNLENGYGSVSWYK